MTPDHRCPTIGIYAGSLRPGGGLTVLAQIIGALAQDDATHLVVYTGAADTTRAVQSLAQSHPNVEVRPFLPRCPSFLRYLASKLLFLRNRHSHGLDWLISFNYHLPANCPVLVYHINLLSFMPGEPDSLGMRIKRLDARLACRHAAANAFESRYLLERAQAATGGRVGNPGVLYVGVHPDFFRTKSAPPGNADIMLVSSVQPYKDNDTCLRALALLVTRRPEVPWRLVVAGGQSAAQWDSLRATATRLGVADRIEIAGRLDRRALSERLSRSLCLISASRIESFCMVAVESMASRCPAVVTSATSMPESVGDAAVVVETGNAEAFADACERFHDDPALRARHVETGVAWAQRFTPEQFRNQLRVLLTRNPAGATP